LLLNQVEIKKYSVLKNKEQQIHQVTARPAGPNIRAETDLQVQSC